MDLEQSTALSQARHLETSDAAVIETSHGKEALKDIAFGSVRNQIAGIVGKYIEYPFDTVKVRLQSQPNGVQYYAGPLDCFRQSIKQNGMLSLYRGISAPLVGAAVETSSLFFGYRIAQSVLHRTWYQDFDVLPMSALVMSGAASGAFTSLLLTPIELIKCKMQVTLRSPSGVVVEQPGPLTLIASIFRHRGFFGFWHGQLGTLIRETGGSAAWFGSYEGVSLAFRNARPDSAPDAPLPMLQQLVAGASAGMTYNFVFYPADTIKSRMQTQDVSTHADARSGSFWAVSKELWRDQGLKGLYRGCGITVGRAAPSSAVIFTIYDWMKRAFAG